MTADFNHIPQFLEQVNQLNRHSVIIGALAPQGDNDVAFLSMIVKVLNDGATIKAKTGKYLTIPTPYAQGKPASAFDHLFTYTIRSGMYKGKKALARNDSGALHIYFYLATQVEIPARNFLGDSQKIIAEKVESITRRGISDLLVGVGDWKSLLDEIGQEATNIVQQVMYAFDNPANAYITQLDKGKNDPLIDTGALAKAMTWQVWGDE